jgi:hypothetical protein
VRSLEVEAAGHGLAHAGGDTDYAYPASAKNGSFLFDLERSEGE